jgi:hypothetical protein
MFEAPGTPIAEPAKQPQSTSFIERYSHMFADDSASESSKSVEPIKPLFADSPNSNPHAMGGTPNDSKAVSSTAGVDEESIEQYMAKLMQRVRGESSTSQDAAAMQPEPVPQPTPEVKAAEPEPMVTAALPSTDKVEAESREDEEEVKEVAVNWEAIARRAAAAPTTNLGALRALANESARRAISRHELKKHRRDAMTKVMRRFGRCWHRCAWRRMTGQGQAARRGRQPRRCRLMWRRRGSRGWERSAARRG